MKIAKISTNYPAYSDQFYLRHPELLNATYSAQVTALANDFFGWANSWALALGKLGHEVHEFVANNRALQTAWARENLNSTEVGIPEIVIEQLRSVKPEVLFVVDPSHFPITWLANIKELCPSIKLAFAWCGSPFTDIEIYRPFDFVLSCIPEVVSNFKTNGVHSFHVNHAFEPRIIDHIDLQRPKLYPCSFLGQIVRTNRFHNERERLLEFLSDQMDVSIFLPVVPDRPAEDFKRLFWNVAFKVQHSARKIGLPERLGRRIPLIGKTLDWELPPIRRVSKKLTKRVRPGLFGLEMYQALRDSLTTLNSHIDFSSQSASNMRLFEATGVGTCLVTDWKENIGKLFEPDFEVVTYKSKEECAEKVRWLLDNPARASEIAEKGQRRTLSQHSYDERAKLVDSIIRKELG